MVSVFGSPALHPALVAAGWRRGRCVSGVRGTMEVTLADWKCAHLRCHFPLHGALHLLLVLMAVLGAAPLSTRRAALCSWPSPLPALRDWGGIC